MATELSLSAIDSVQRRRGLRTRFGASLMMAGSRCAALAVQFLLQIAVGSLAGPAGLGILQLFASWYCMLGEVVARGLPALAMRVVAVEVAGGREANAWGKLRWAAMTILRIAAKILLVVSLLLLLGAGHFWEEMAHEYRLLVLAVALGAPLFALLRLGSEALKGAGDPLNAITIENLVIPGVLLMACGVCWIVGRPLDAATILGVSCLAIAAAVAAIWLRVYGGLRPNLNGKKAVALEPTDTKDLNALWANSVMAIMFVQLPFLLLPWFATPEDIGVYAVAYKLLNVVTTLLILLAAVFGPAFARAAVDEGSQSLSSLLRRTQWLSCAIFLPLALAIYLAIDPLAQLFNLPSGELRTYLLILAAGQSVNAVTGLSGILLNMSGGAKLEMRALVMSILLALVATPFLGLNFGVTGLAVLFSAVMAFKNLASYVAAIIYLRRREEVE